MTNLELLESKEYVHKFELLKRWAEETCATFTSENLLWLETGRKGVCPSCDYGSEHSHPVDYNPMKEHDPDCLFKAVVLELAKTDVASKNIS